MSPTYKLSRTLAFLNRDRVTSATPRPKLETRSKFRSLPLATRLTAEAARLWASDDIEAAQRCFVAVVALVEGYRVVGRPETSDR